MSEKNNLMISKINMGDDINDYTTTTKKSMNFPEIFENPKPKNFSTQLKSKEIFLKFFRTIFQYRKW